MDDLNLGFFEGSGFTPFDRRTRLFDMARRLLLARLAVAELDPLIANLLSDEVLPHVESIERGQHASLRHAGLDPRLVQEFVRRAGVGTFPWAGSATTMVAADERARELAAGRAGFRAIEIAILENAAHAELVLAFIPRLPDTAVGWPLRTRHSYLDIPAPHDDGERIARVEEIEQVLWRVATGATPMAAEPWRRTFAFFETGVWLDRMALGLLPPV